jgi:hypothetical protein
MIEEGFVQMYARDFAAFAAKAEAGLEVEAALLKRIGEARAHAALMDARKSEGHLAAVSERLKLESRRTSVREMRVGPDPDATMARREAFLIRVAELLDAEPAAPGPVGIAVRP